MKLAIMQPYFFPYIGYFQLIHAVDKFVVYDDVNYIKQGWIDRNRLLINGQAFSFKLPISSASSFTKINDTLINTNRYSFWCSKFIKTIVLNYNKAPYFKEVLELIQKVIEHKFGFINQIALCSLVLVCEYLDIHTPIIKTSSVYNNSAIKAQDRIIDICFKEKATEYINTFGGTKLYDKETFRAKGINLLFIQPKHIEYTQLNHKFVADLSIIDVMMFNSKNEIKEMLDAYDIL